MNCSRGLGESAPREIGRERGEDFGEAVGETGRAMELSDGEVLGVFDADEDGTGLAQGLMSDGGAWCTLRTSCSREPRAPRCSRRASCWSGTRTIERFLRVLGSAASAGVRSFRVVLKKTDTVESGKDARVETTSCNVSERSKASLTCLSVGVRGRR